VLDDVLSGVDAHTAKHIILGLFGTEGLLRLENVAVVIATSSRTCELIICHTSALCQMLTGSFVALLTSIADDVLILGEGQLVPAGSVNRVLGPLPLDQHELQKTETESRSHQHAAAVRPDAARSRDIFAEQSIDLRRQQGDWSVYSYYVRAAGWYHTLFFLIGMTLGMACVNYSSSWPRSPYFIH
jgi:ATP-binding cassette, subfamily C (CFTR/MRP), member 1